MKKNKSTIILILVFFVGLSVMLYPTISDYVNQRNQSRAVPPGYVLSQNRKGFFNYAFMSSSC